MEKIYLTLSAGTVETIIKTMAAKISTLEYTNDYLNNAAQSVKMADNAVKAANEVTSHE